MSAACPWAPDVLPPVVQQAPLLPARTLVPPTGDRNTQFTGAQEAMRYVEQRLISLLDPTRGLSARPEVKLLELCVDLFCGSNLAICFLDSPVFHAFAWQMLPLQPMPTRRQLREAIIPRVNEIRFAITAQSEGRIFATRFVDGASAAQRSWLARVVATARGFHFWRLQQQQNGKAETVAASFSAVINE
jgi:hypothetical protein